MKSSSILPLKPVTVAVLFAMMGIGVFALPDSEAATSTGTASAYRKALVPHGSLGSAPAGALLVEDYGTFGLYRVDANLAVGASPTVRIDNEADVLKFSAYPFDTQRETLQVPAPFSSHADGPGLQVVQFVGPVKQQWLDALSARGIKPVQYVASNGYIVWADTTAQTRLSELRDQSPWLQFSAPFLGFLKVDAGLRTRILANSDEEVDVVVQVYRHDGVGATRAFVENKGVLSPSQLGPLGNGKSGYAWAPVLDFENLTVRLRVSDIPAIADRPDVTSVGEYLVPRMLDEKQGIIMTGDLAPGPATASYLQFLLQRGFSQSPGDYPIVDVTDSTIHEGGTGATVVNTADNMLHVKGILANPSRVAYFKNCSALADEVTGAYDSHGTLNGGIIADYDQRVGYPFQDSDGQRLGLGINPFGRIGSTTIFIPRYNIDNCGGTDQGVILANWQNGARISSNSWGAGENSAYSAAAQIYDAGVRDANPGAGGNQQLIYVFSAGNSGPEAGTLGSPGTAKNVITVGASENLRPFASPPDSQCGTDPANDPRNVVDFSSRGPAQGERRKPEVLAPGTHIQAGASIFADYDGSGVCMPYFPQSPDQQIFTYSSGTSHSAPAVAGVASLAYFWIEQGGTGSAAGTVAEIGGNRAPSPAMMKAWLIAHPSYLDGVGGNDSLPSNAQGYGMPNMSDMFSDTPKLLVDQSETFDNSGETRSYTLAIADTTKPIRIALAYTDAPGALATGSLVNDLDLEVQAEGETYRGNSFDQQWSTVGGAADTTNNYEAIFLPVDTTGDITITVTGINIAGDGVPNTGDATDQDYALVCSNCVLSPTYTLTSPQLSPSVCVGDDFSADVAVGSIEEFAEPVDFSVTGAPAGTSQDVTPPSVTPPGTTRLSITGTGGVVAGDHYPVVLTGASGAITKTLGFDLTFASAAPPAPALLAPADGATNVDLHPVLTWDAASEASSYRVEVADDAGFTRIVASAEVRDTFWTVPTSLESSAQHYWRVTAKNGCGQSLDQLFGDGFDGAAVVPTTPVYRFTTLAQAGDCQVGSTPQVLFAEDMEAGVTGWGANGWRLGAPANSGTQAYKADHDPFLALGKELISPVVELPSTFSSITLSFWNQQSMAGFEDVVCFDGALLEISTNGGINYTQITEGLLTDPYDAPVTFNYSNPLAGLLAWCDNPQAYLNSVVDLTPYAGNPVKLRFSMANSSNGIDDPRPPNPAWAIDDVKITGCIAD